MKKFRYILCALMLLMTTAAAHAQRFDVKITKSGTSSETLSKIAATLITLEYNNGSSKVTVQSGTNDQSPATATFEDCVRYDFTLTKTKSVTLGKDEDLPDGDFTAGAKPRRTESAPSTSDLTAPALVLVGDASSPHYLDAEHTSITLAMSADGKYVVNGTEVSGTVSEVYFYSPDMRFSQLKLVNLTSASIADIGEYSYNIYPWTVSDNAEYAPGLKSYSFINRFNNQSKSSITISSEKEIRLSFKYKNASDFNTNLSIFINNDSITKRIWGGIGGSYSNTLPAGTYTITLNYRNYNYMEDGCSYLYDFAAISPCDEHTYSVYPNKCDVCGYTTEHDHLFAEGESAVAATCTEGSKKLCALCNEFAEDGQTEALRHSLNNQDICSRCHKIILTEAPKNETDGYYEVSTAGQLYWIADYFTNGKNLGNQYVRLVKDIKVNEQVLKADGSLVDDTKDLFAWSPISMTSGNLIFDGCGHTISGVYYKNPQKVSRVKSALFTDIQGVIMNLCVEDSYFHGSLAGSVFVSGDNSNVNIYNVISKATSDAYQIACGISNNADNIENCIFIGKLSSYYDMKYAFDGNPSSIKNSYYLANQGYDSWGYNTVNVQALTPEQFATGKAAYDLSQCSVTVDGKTITTPWYQRIGTDTYPSLQGDKTSVVYKNVDQYFNLEIKETMDFTDATAYTSDSPTEVGTLTYKRTFVDNDFNCLYVPFEVPVSDFTDCSIYAINMFQEHDTDGDGVLDQLTLEVNKATSGTILPNHPYLIKYIGSGVNEEQSFTFYDVTLVPASTPEFTCSSMSTDYVFKGTYSNVDAATATAGTYYSLTVDGEGNTVLGPTSNGVKAQRWYMTKTSRNPQLDLSSVNAAKAIRIVADDESTSINDVNVNDNDNLNGKYMENGRIIIVKNGKKFNINGQEIK